MKSMTRRSLAVVLAVLMVVSTFMVGTISASAATPTTVYFDNSVTGWSTVKCYYWGGEATAPSWPGTNMTKGTDNIWSITLPATPDSVIFNNGTTQSADLTYPGDGYTAKPNSADGKFTVTWSKDGQAATEPVTTDYYVAGEAGLCGVAWNEKAEANKMTANADGSYEKVYTDVAAGTYKFKITNGTWNNALTNNSANDNDGNSAVTVAKAGSKVTIKLTADKQVVSSVTAPTESTTAASQSTTAASEATTAPAGTQTIVFTDNQNWGTVYVHYWGGATASEWPGVAMTKGEDNGYGSFNFSATIPADATSVVFTKGQNGPQTPDVTLVAGAAGYYYDADSQTVKAWFDEEPTTAASEATTAASEATTAASEATTAATEATTAPAGTQTIVFTDNQNWGTVYVHYWGGATASEWPGVAMTKGEDNGYGSFNFSATIPADATSVVFTKGQNGPQTPDVTLVAGAAGYYYDADSQTVKAWFDEEPTTAASEATTAASEATTAASEATTAATEATTAPAGTQTIVFTDNQNWGTVYVHYWGGATASEWPGVAMTKGEDNGYGSFNFSATIPADATSVVFTKGQNGPQTPDVTLVAGAAGYYYDADSQTVKAWFDEEPTTAASEATTAASEATTAASEATTAPAGTQTIVFTDNQNWGTVYVHYWGGATASEWPGVAMTKGEDNGYGSFNFSATIPADATSVVFTKGQNGPQTPDVTLVAGAAGYYYDADSQTVKAWFDEEPTTAASEATTAASEATTAASEATTAATEATTAPAGTQTIVFTDNQNWGTVYVHYWGGATASEWPGVAMTKGEDNGYGSFNFSATIPADATSVVFTKGQNGPQTPDVTLVAGAAGYYYDADSQTVKAWFDEEPTTAASEATTAASEATTAASEATTAATEATTAPAGTQTIVFTDNQNWGTVYVHYWGGATASEWPGVAMTKGEDNGYGSFNFSATIPADATSVVFTKGQNGPQTPDVTLVAGAAGYYYDADSQTVKAWFDEEPTTAASEATTAASEATTAASEATTAATEATTAPAGTQTIVFTDNQNWGTVYVHYWGGATASEWPGVAMTKGEDNGYGSFNFSATIPADATSVVFTKGQNGPQTPDVTLVAGAAGYYYDADSQTVKAWFDEEPTTAASEATTAASEATTAASEATTAATEATTAPAGTQTIVFTDNQNWGTVYVHYWGGATASEWPGVAMTKGEDNGYGSFNFSATIPADATSVVFTKGQNGPQTPDVTLVAGAAGYYYDADSQTVKAWFDEEPTTAASEATTAASEATTAASEATTAATEATTAPAGTQTIVFTDNQNWGTVYVHYWGGATASEWPGVAMTKGEDNGYGSFNFSATIPADATSVVFTKGQNGPQTPDVTLVAGAAGYYYDADSQTVKAWFDEEPTTAASEATTAASEATTAASEATTAATEATTAPAGTQTIVFTDNQNWGTVYVHYWGGATASEWPGVAMTKGEDNGYGSFNFSATIPADATSVVFTKGQNGPQTPDVTLVAGAAGYYYDADSQTVKAWFDEEPTTAASEATTAASEATTAASEATTAATEETTAASEETTAATEATTAATEATTAASEETTAATEATTAATEATTAPSEETTAPSEETTAATEATTAPSEDTTPVVTEPSDTTPVDTDDTTPVDTGDTTPVDTTPVDTTAPTDATTAPTDATTAPTDATTAPTDATATQAPNATQAPTSVAPATQAPTTVTPAATVPTAAVSKADNTMTVKAKKITAKAGKKVTVKKAKAFKIKNAVGKVTFRKFKGNKKIVVKKNGTIIVKKGLKKGKYTIKVKVTAKGNASTKKLTKTVKVKIKIK